VRRQVERRFGNMPCGRAPRRLATEPAQTAPRAVAALRDVNEAYVAVGFHVPPARHVDVAALDVAAILLGETESARLSRRLRDEDDVVTSAYAQVHALRDPGLFVLSATARPRDAKKTVGGLVDQALALVDDLSADELASPPKRDSFASSRPRKGARAPSAGTRR
jgi:predicted Zn-dependent peptidase